MFTPEQMERLYCIAVPKHMMPEFVALRFALSLRERIHVFLFDAQLNRNSTSGQRLRLRNRAFLESEPGATILTQIWQRILESPRGGMDHPSISWSLGGDSCCLSRDSPPHLQKSAANEKFRSQTCSSPLYAARAGAADELIGITVADGRCKRRPTAREAFARFRSRRSRAVAI